MKFSKDLFPQYDDADGTIGHTKLERRWVLVKGDGNMMQARQGRFTHPTREEAQIRCDAFLQAQPPGSPMHEHVVGLHVEEWWCYPRHFDPVGPVPEIAAAAEEETDPCL